jgi:hypothetical protein
MFRNVAVNNNDGDVALCYTVEFSTVPVQKNKVLGVQFSQVGCRIVLMEPIIKSGHRSLSDRGRKQS